MLSLLLYCLSEIPIKNLDHHADHIVRRSPATTVPVLHGPQRNAEAVSELGLPEAVLDADVFDGHALTSLLSRAISSA